MADNDLEERKRLAAKAAAEAELAESFGNVPVGTARKKMQEYEALMSQDPKAKKDPLAK